jgi:transcriptional regulator with XRE-family HTH domain
MGVRDTLAVNLRLYRHRRGLTQEELAYRASMDRTYVSALERGVYGATIDVLDRLARALDVEVWELLKS